MLHGLQWRWTTTFPSIGRWDYTEWIFYWWWTFFLAEVFLAIAVWIGLAQRLFPVQRIKVLCIAYWLSSSMLFTQHQFQIFEGLFFLYVT